MKKITHLLYFLVIPLPYYSFSTDSDSYLTGKTLHLCGELVTHAKNNALPGLEKLKEAAQAHYQDLGITSEQRLQYAFACQAPEGLIAHETAESLHSSKNKKSCVFMRSS